MILRKIENVKPEQKPNNDSAADNSHVSPACAKRHVIGGFVMVQPSKSRKYRPTKNQWKKIFYETEIDTGCSYSQIELINFETSKIHLKGGARLSFDCLSEAQYIHVLNGGFYEDAAPINDEARV